MCRARTFKTRIAGLGSVLGVSGPRTEPGVEPAEADSSSPEPSRASSPEAAGPSAPKPADARAPAAGRSGVVRARPVRDGVGLGLAVGVSGVAFGAAAVSSGLSTWQACALSLLAFTGASQFALAAVIASGGSLLAGTAGAILLGSRNTLYGLRLADLLRARGPLRLLAALGVIDETTAITLAQPDPAAARTGFTATFCTLYLTWNLATLGGAIGAGRLGSPDTFGLDVVGPAAFLALIWPRLRAGRTERQVALGGAALAVGTTTVLPVGVPVVLAATVALAGALAGPVASSAPASHSESSRGTAP
jgi:predicted branched-subunit amino acid permease